MKTVLLSRAEIISTLNSNKPLIKDSLVGTNESISIRVDRFVLQWLLELLDSDPSAASKVIRYSLSDSILLRAIEMSAPSAFNFKLECMGVLLEPSI